MPAVPQLSTKRRSMICFRIACTMDEPRSLVLAEIHAEPFFKFVPEPSASEINGEVADISESLSSRPAMERKGKQSND